MENEEEIDFKNGEDVAPLSVNHKFGSVDGSESDLALDELDDLHLEDDDNNHGQRESQTAPLLTGIEAPFVTIAQGLHGGVDEDDEEAGQIQLNGHAPVKMPESGGNLVNGLMNMANSILGAGMRRDCIVA